MSSSSADFNTRPISTGSQASFQSQRRVVPNRNGLSGKGIPAYFVSRRHRKVLRDNLRSTMTKPAIRHLARRGGIMRIKSDIYPTIQEVVRDRLKLIIQYAVALVELAGRKTMTALDIVFALRSIGSPIYGFGMVEKGEGIIDHAARYKEKKRRYAEERERIARQNTSRSATHLVQGDRVRTSDGLGEERPRQREMQNRRVDEFMRQMKRGTRC